MGEYYDVFANGSLANYTEYEGDDRYPMEIPHIQVILIFCYVVVFICCVVGKLFNYISDLELCAPILLNLSRPALARGHNRAGKFMAMWF